ncbi:hypothetical protein BPOR_0374g00100 [Botrytis porri]|uniref:Uncharacterized protein n=1 Tax=Botrytis porri TaxID=87229 RepID=A0A4Z1KK19_9HELO|nr:hypothetical protein BPOR_0374g00100 [Botrytis porri]
MKVEWTIPSSELEGQDQHAATCIKKLIKTKGDLSAKSSLILPGSVVRFDGKVSNKGAASVSAGLGSYRDDNVIALCTPSLCSYIHDIT